MARAFLWCRHCGQPHPVGLPQCPTTQKPLSTRVNKEPKIPIRRASAPELELPDFIAPGSLIDNRYRVQKNLGEGASSRVYLAQDTALDRVVALKIMRSTANRARAFLRFEQEARVMLAISHPNVCRVFGFGRMPDSRPYLVMEFVEGKTLLAYMRSKRRPFDEFTAIGLIQQLLAGLSASHKLGIVHRDVKPSNIFVAKETHGIGILKLLDFGLAKAPAERAVIVTRPGHAFGTPGYAAPEVLSGGAATQACDVWSTGVILFELMAGVRPFPDPTAELSPFALACGPARKLRDYAPDASDEIIAVLETALAKNPQGRFASAEAFSHRLAEIADEYGPSSSEAPTQTMLSTLAPMSPDPILPVLDRTPLTSLSAESGDDSPASSGGGYRPYRR